MDYEDFEIEIRSAAGGGHEARVLRSPRGRVAETFVPPFSAAELVRVLESLQGQIGQGGERDLQNKARSASPDPPVEVDRLGEILAERLFPGRVGRYLYWCLGLQEGRRRAGQQAGLRLRICFDREERFAPLAALPWELLRLDGTFLTQGRQTPVVRYLESGRPQPYPLAEGLRVLLVVSAPVDLPALETDRERGRAREALKQLEGAEIDELLQPSVQGLRARLLDSEYHVVHFLGHGDFDPSTGAGCLLFETEDRLSQPVDGLLLGSHLQGIPSLRLVVLNACWGAVFPRHEGQDPFSGVAAALTLRGMPAVVAMQFPVTDTAAITFSETLYRRLAALDPVDAAVTEGRLAICACDPESTEWATPVLFLGVDDGRIFHETSPDAPAMARHRGRDQESLRLEIRCYGERETADPCLDLRRLFDGPHPREAGFWQAAFVPRLRDFLETFLDDIQPLVLHLAAPTSLAFLAGALLESWSGLDLRVVEETAEGEVVDLAMEPGSAPKGRRWREGAPRVLDATACDVALAVEIGRTLRPDVDLFVESADLPLGRLVPLAAVAEREGDGLPSGGEALRLAQQLSLRIRARTAAERDGTLHLFTAAPAAFSLYLGQLARDLGRVQLYEPAAKGYRPSLRFPVDPV